MVDTQPTVTNVTSTKANAKYKAGVVIPIQITFSEEVNVTGTPQLELETGSTDRLVNYTSGSGTNELTFNYTVQAGDTSSNLNYKSTSSLTLNGGTINDIANNEAILILPALNGSDSLGTQKSIVIDTAPTISSITPSWGTHLNATEDNSDGTVTVATSGVEDGQTVTIALNGKNYTGDISSNSVAITIQGSDLRDLSEGTHTITANVSDAAGNAATESSVTFVYDKTAPTVSSFYISDTALKSGDTSTVTIVFSEAVH